MKEYNIITYRVAKADSPDTKGANAVIFINRGTMPCFVNNERLEQGQIIANSGLHDEIDTTLYRITFDNSDDTKTPLVYVRVKIYKK